MNLFDYLHILPSSWCIYVILHKSPRKLKPHTRMLIIILLNSFVIRLATHQALRARPPNLLLRSPLATRSRGARSTRSRRSEPWTEGWRRSWNAWKERMWISRRRYKRTGEREGGSKEGTGRDEWEISFLGWKRPGGYTREPSLFVLLISFSYYFLIFSW